MGSSHDGPNIPSGLGQRRQAASHLPQFELPPPPNLQLAAQQLGHKFPPLSLAGNGPSGQSVSVGNLLTPPSNSASESGASSLNLPPGSTPHHQGIPVLPYSPAFWGPGATPGYSTGLTPQPWQNNSLYGARSMFSPGPLSRTTNSPAAGEHSSLPPPPYELTGTHNYTNSMNLASPPVTGHSGAHQVMANMMPIRPSSQASPISPHDVGSKPSAAAGLYTSMSAAHTPQPSQYGLQSTTPVSQSSHPASRVSPPLHQGSMGQMPSQSHLFKPPYHSYSLPAMPGPVMTNIQSPGSQPIMMGGAPAPGLLPMSFNSGYAANPQTMYGHQRANSPAQAAANDRPYKCDQCPQSFNRNHDLKRHKRIHLAVKPFPCKHCDKSFSRKDALKRHILVKGCGNSSSTENDGAKSETGSDSITSDAPQVSVVA